MGALLVDRFNTHTQVDKQNTCKTYSKICPYRSELNVVMNYCMGIDCTDPQYSGSPSSGSDVVRLFAKLSAKSSAPREIAHTGSYAHKNKECVHTLKSVLTSLPEDGEQEYIFNCYRCVIGQSRFILHLRLHKISLKSLLRYERITQLYSVIKSLYKSNS